MALELFANNAIDELASSIIDSDLTLDVVSASLFPATGNFRIRIEDELMLVTGVSSNTFTVTRGIEGTTAVGHSGGEAVSLVLTKGALDTRRSDDVGFDVIANRPSAGRSGALYIPSTGPLIQRDNGASWDSFGPFFKFTQPPAIGSFTGINTSGGGTATASDNGGSISVKKTAQGGINWTGWFKSAPSTPYTITAAMKCWAGRASFLPAFGLGFRQASDGAKLHAISVVHNSNVVGTEVRNYTSATTVGTAKLAIFNSRDMDLWWMRIEDDGTNRKYYISVDGFTWFQLTSHSRTTDITPDQVGFFVDNQTATYDMLLVLYSWKEE